MTIIGISGSPIANSNTDRMIKSVIEESGSKGSFIKLSKLNYFPCRACAHLCATTNMCGVMDDLQPLIKDIRDADALIFGSPVHNGQMTGWMYSFITRLWCLHHVHELLKGKPILFVSTGLANENYSNIYSIYIREYYPKIIGDIYYCSGIAPCLKCGAGTYCHVGGLWKSLGCSEEALKNFEFTPDKFRRWEDDQETVEKVKIFGKILSEIV